VGKHSSGAASTVDGVDEDIDLVDVVLVQILDAPALALSKEM